MDKIAKSKKERCKEIMARLFGPATASLVDRMDESNCVEKSRLKVETILGKDVADKEFSRFDNESEPNRNV